MVYYIKVTPEVAKRFCNLALRNTTKDGNILLWMGDLDQVPGDTLKERAAYVGGALLDANKANSEYWGTTDGYEECYTPEYYDGKPRVNTDNADAGSTDSADKSGDMQPGTGQESSADSELNADTNTNEQEG